MPETEVCDELLTLGESVFFVVQKGLENAEEFVLDSGAGSVLIYKSCR